MKTLDQLTIDELLDGWANARTQKAHAVYADHPGIREREEREGNMGMRMYRGEIERRIAGRAA